MKKKILIGLGAIALAVLLTINVTFITNESKSELSLNTMGMIMQAEAEDDGNTYNDTQLCKEDDCSTTIATGTYYGHYRHCGYGGSGCSFYGCWQGCDAL